MRSPAPPSPLSELREHRTRDPRTREPRTREPRPRASVPHASLTRGNGALDSLPAPAGATPPRETAGQAPAPHPATVAARQVAKPSPARRAPQAPASSAVPPAHTPDPQSSELRAVLEEATARVTQLTRAFRVWQRHLSLGPAPAPELTGDSPRPEEVPDPAGIPPTEAELDALSHAIEAAASARAQLPQLKREVVLAPAFTSAALTRGVVHVADAYALAELDDVSVSEQGAVDPAALEAALTALAEARPYLFAASTQSVPGIDKGTGDAAADDARSLRDAAVATRTTHDIQRYWERQRRGLQ